MRGALLAPERHDALALLGVKHAEPCDFSRNELAPQRQFRTESKFLLSGACDNADAICSNLNVRQFFDKSDGVHDPDDSSPSPASIVSPAKSPSISTTCLTGGEA